MATLPFTNPDYLESDLISALLITIAFAPVVYYLIRRRAVWIVSRVILLLIGSLVAIGLLSPFFPDWVLAIIYVLMWHVIEITGLFYAKSPQPNGLEKSQPTNSTTPLLNQLAITATDLNPSGKIEFDGIQHDAISQGEFIQKGENVEIIDNTMGSFHVRKL